MIIGVPREIKPDEYRVGMLPVGAELLTEDGHEVLIERQAGLESGYSDQDYIDAGAKIVDSEEVIYSESAMVVKVKEPQPPWIFDIGQPDFREAG